MRSKVLVYCTLFQHRLPLKFQQNLFNSFGVMPATKSFFVSVFFYKRK